MEQNEKRGWAIAQSPILGTTITLQRLKQRGYVFLTELHLQLNPSLGVYADDKRQLAEYGTRMLGGVRGALRQFLAEPSTRLAVVSFFKFIYVFN